MDTAETQILPSPPSLIKALLTGFDAISNQVGLIVFSIALDLLLWLGPRLSLTALVQSLFDRAAELPEMATPEMTEMLRASQDVWLLMVGRLNMLNALRTFPVGVPSLMASRVAVEMPLSQVSSWEVPSLAAALGIWLLLSLAGISLGALYFGVVAQAALNEKVFWGQAVRSWPRTSLQAVLLSIFWMALVLGISLPFSCVMSFFLLSGIGGGQLALLVYAGVMAWIFLPLVFSPHGIFLNGQNMWTSVKDGARLVQRTIPTTLLLLLSVLILSEGLDVLWSVPPETSWLTLVGMAGHAFVTTGLLAATFIYYRDAEKWVQRVIQQAKLAGNRK